jgi:hypothetical protein
MYDPNHEPDIFGAEPENLRTSNDSFQEAQRDLEELPDDEFLYRYKATKQQYQTLLTAIHELEKANAALSELGALAIDPEIGDNTTMLIDDYSRLLEQMHMASYWEREGH